MFEDYVFFTSDLQRMLMTADTLGYSRINVVVESKDIEKAEKEMSAMKHKVELVLCLSVDSKKDVNIAKKKNIQTIYVYSGGEDPREVISSLKPAMITNLEYQKRDFMHHRSSGLNQVTSKLLSDKAIVLGFNMGFLKKTKYKDSVMGRMEQNLSLAKKYDLEVKSFSMAKRWNEMVAPKEIISLLSVIGTDLSTAKKSITLSAK